MIIAPTTSPPLLLLCKTTLPDSSDTEMIEKVPNTQSLWNTVSKEMKPYYIIMGDVYPESWGARKILSKTVE